jgi:hypothetical protein
MLPFYKAPVSPELMKANKQGAKGLATYLAGPRKPTKLSQLGDAMLTAALDGRNSDLETLKRRFDAAPPNPISDDLIALAYEPTRMEE